MKAIIADDEHLVRYSLRSMLEELQIGITIVAEAANGEDLLIQIGKHHPDICFVDIRMPGINGLSAIKKARDAGSRARWIILTSHAEFEYASEAIRLGASAYLLKPAGPSNLSEMLVPLIKELEEERQERAIRFERSLMVAMGSSNPEIAELPPLSTAWLVLLHLDCAAAAAHSDCRAFGSDTILKLRALIASCLTGSLVAATWLLEPEVIIVTAAWEDTDGDSHQASSSLREQISIMVQSTADTSLHLTGVAADGLHSWLEFGQALAASRDFLPYRIVFGNSTIHALAALQRRLASISQPRRAISGLVEDFILARERGDVPDLGDRAQLIRDCLAAAGTSPGLDNVARYLAFRTGMEAPPLGASSSDLLNWADNLVASTRAALADIRRSADANTRVVEKVEQYLRLNLNSEIRVPAIASALGLSPNYLSSVYHKLTHCTISERLVGLRLDMARQLLAHPGSQVKDVAAKVGYKSTRHFAQLYHGRFGSYPSGR